MGNDARRKQKQRLKRQQKRTSQRRALGLSPYGKLKHAGDVEACYINGNWKESGIANILALRKVPGGYALGAYLVDLTCLGLKDAWGRIDIGKPDFREMLDHARESIDMVRVAPETAWRLVAGGVRWAKEHEFRLPARYERWVSVLGSVADCASADVEEFGTEEGGLLYVGPLEDLRRRLLGCSLEQFLARDDVHYIAPVRASGFGGLDGDPDDGDTENGESDPADDAELEAYAQSICNRLVRAVQKFLAAQSIEPHPRLPEAVKLVLLGSMQAPLWERAVSEDQEEGLSQQEPATAEANIERVLAMVTPESRAELRAGAEQIAMFMQQFDNVADVLKALGSSEPV